MEECGRACSKRAVLDEARKKSNVAFTFLGSAKTVACPRPGFGAKGILVHLVM